MSEETKVVNSGGIGVGGIMFLALFFLKVFEVAPIAAWSWWWIFAPLWIPFVLGIGLIAVVFLVEYWTDN